MGFNHKNRNDKKWVPSSDHESEDNNENETNTFLSPSGSMEYRRGLTYRASVVLPWILHAILAIGYLSIAVLWSRREPFHCFDDKLLSPPIVWENRHFSSAVEIDRGVVDDSFGPSSPTLEAEWEKLLDVGVIRITAEEMQRMPAETAHLYGSEDGYAGILEVFHQMHCLNRLRSRFQHNHTTDANSEHPHLDHSHDKHCFSYLWQTVLCHADVSVMSLEYNEEQHAFNTNFDVIKQCRNFDVIHNWAKARQAKHKAPRVPKGCIHVDLIVLEAVSISLAIYCRATLACSLRFKHVVQQGWRSC